MHGQVDQDQLRSLSLESLVSPLIAGRSLDDLAEETGAVDVPGGLVGTGAAATILVLDTLQLSRPRGRGLVPSFADLKSGLLVGREDKIPPDKRLPLPEAFVQV